MVGIFYDYSSNKGYNLAVRCVFGLVVEFSMVGSIANFIWEDYSLNNRISIYYRIDFMLIYDMAFRLMK